MPRLILGLLLLLAVPALAGELRFSGVLGQSQPPEAEPLTAIGANGLACDLEGALWTFADDGRLCRFVRNETGWWLERAVKPPVPPGAVPLREVGEDLMYSAQDGKLWRFSPATGKFAVLVQLPPKTVAGQALEPGQEYACLVLADDAVLGLPAGGGNDWTPLFKPVRPEKGNLYSVCRDPAGAGVLVGSSYPDMKVRRYDWDGRELTSSLWPKPRVHSLRLVTAGGRAWALNNLAVALGSAEEVELGGKWLERISGVAHTPDGNWWLATSQGLVGYAADLKPLGIRLGGMNGPSLLAAAPDGTLIAYDSGRMLRFMIDDAADAPLRCDSRAIFRVGANYKSRGAAMQFDGQAYVVLDDQANRLWRFDPDQTGYREQTWLPLTAENAFEQPQALALGGGRIFIRVRGEVLARPYPGDAPFAKLSLTAEGPLAANRDGWLWLTAKGRLVALAPKADGSFEKRWQTKIDPADVIGLAAGEEYVVLIEKSAARVVILSARDGSPYAALAAADLPGGLLPASVALQEPWVFVGDQAGRRILRLRIR